MTFDHEFPIGPDALGTWSAWDSFELTYLMVKTHGLRVTYWPERVEVVRRLRDEGHTVTEISEITGLRRPSVKWALDGNGPAEAPTVAAILEGSNDVRRRRRTARDNAVLDALADMPGATKAEVGRRFGMTAEAVLLVFRRARHAKDPRIAAFDATRRQRVSA